MTYRFGDCELDVEQYELRRAGAPVHVQPQVFDVLAYLVANRSRVVTKEELLDEVWGDRFVGESALTSRLRSARRAVGDDGGTQAVIRTVHGRGYQFVAPVEETGVDPLPAEPKGNGQTLAGAPTDPILGRADELSAVAALLDAARLVTVVGAGGSGKTRLAWELAQRHGSAVAFVELAKIADPERLADALAQALGIQEGQRADLTAACVEYLAAVPHLVVMDNCEHVLAAAGALANRLLPVCPELRILATSREPVGHAAEHVFRLGPLPVPPPGEADSGEAPVLALFSDRARRVRPDFELTPDTAEKVRSLCESLDGLPLAVELAAGRLAALDLDDLRSRLDRRLDLLGAARGSIEDRHRTLRATLDWSYGLLDEDEQRLLRHLAVFPAGVTLGTAEWLGQRIGLSADPAAAMARLVETSVVVRTGSASGSRYNQLETVRSFGVDRLAHHGELDAAHTGLAAWVAWFGADAAVGVASADEAVWNDRVRQELPNVRAARAELLRAGDIAGAVQLSKDLHDWGKYRGAAELWRWQHELLALTDGWPPAERADVLAMASHGAWRRGRLDEGRELALAALDADTNGWGRPHALISLGAIELFRGNVEAAIDAWVGDPVLTNPFATGSAAVAAVYGGDFERAQAYLAASQAAASASGIPSHQAWTDYAAGELAWHTTQDGHEARLETAVSLAERVGLTFVEGVATVTLASSRAQRGAGRAAADGYAYLIDLWLRSGSWTQQWTTLRNAAELLAGSDDETALTLLAAARSDADAPVLYPDAEAREVELRDRLLRSLGSTRAEQIEAAAVSMARPAVAERALAALRAYSSAAGSGVTG